METMYFSQTGSPRLSLLSDITSSDKIIPVEGDVTQLPSPPNIVTIYNTKKFETILYKSININNNELEKVTRGFEGTPKKWASGDYISRILTAHDINSVQNNIIENKNNIFSGNHNDLSNIKKSDHHNKYTNSEAVNAVNAETNLSVNIDGDSDTVDGYDIQKNGTDGSGIINFKT